MKKVKLFIGFLVVGLGLLVSPSFSDYYDIQLVSTKFPSGLDFQSGDYSKSYSYLFRSDLLPDSNGYGYLGYGLYYNKNLVVNRLSNNYVPNTLFNNSVTQLDLFTGNGRGSPAVPINIDRFSNWSNSIKILIGEGSNNGKLFITYNDLGESLIHNPTFGFGPGFFTSSEYSVNYSNDWNNGLRLFYNTTGNNNLDSIDFVGPVNSSPSIIAWQLFGSNNQVLTNNGYLIDTLRTKGKIFGGLGYGYSFIHYFYTTGTKLAWRGFGFSTVDDYVYRVMSSSNGYNLPYYDTDNNYHTDYILALKQNQYSTNTNNGTILISKDPTNSKHLLYQEFNCNTNNIKCLFSGGTSCLRQDGNTNNSSDFRCLVLSQGLLANGEDLNILPFEDFKTPVEIPSNSFVKYLISSDGALGNVYTNGNQLCFGSFDVSSAFCFDKVSSSDSIKDNYLDGKYSDKTPSTGNVNNTVEDYCLNDPLFNVRNPELCNGINPSDSIIIDGQCYNDTRVCYTSTGNDTVYCSTKLIPCDFTGEVYIDEDGNYYYIQSGNDTSITLNPLVGNINFLTGFIDSGGMLSGAYFDNFFDGNWFASCPYPYTEILSNLTHFNIAGFYPFLPLSCFVSAFIQGSSVHYFDDYDVFTGTLNQGLLYGNTKYHQILFRFFDVLLALGIYLVLSSLIHLFKK